MPAQSREELYKSTAYPIHRKLNQFKRNNASFAVHAFIHQSAQQQGPTVIN